MQFLVSQRRNVCRPRFIRVQELPVIVNLDTIPPSSKLSAGSLDERLSFVHLRFSDFFFFIRVIHVRVRAVFRVRPGIRSLPTSFIREFLTAGLLPPKDKPLPLNLNAVESEQIPDRVFRQAQIVDDLRLHTRRSSTCVKPGNRGRRHRNTGKPLSRARGIAAWTKSIFKNILKNSFLMISNYWQ